MFGNTFKKLVEKPNDQKNNNGHKLGSYVREKSEKLRKIIYGNVESVKKEIFTIREKCDNLCETNYKLGSKHLANGKLSEAIFRFRFTKKMWPDFFDAYYSLAYCLVLNKKLIEAKKHLEELLAKKPDYNPKAKALLDMINKKLSTSSDE